jgi:hypothetical protein
VAWGKDSGLEFNASKTVAVMFTNKKPYNNKKPHDYPVKVVNNNKKIDFSAEAKYLGILMDSKLTWASHITAKRLLFAVKNCIAKQVGPKPSLTRQAYKALVVPSLSYGCHIFAHRLDTGAAQNKLSSINRLACLSLGTYQQARLPLPWRFCLI